MNQILRNRNAVRNCQKNNAELIRNAKNRPCEDCKIQYPYYVMQFDHLRDKKFVLGSGKGVKFGKKRIMEEIEKCEVVCANCHAIRTFFRRFPNKVIN